MQMSSNWHAGVIPIKQSPSQTVLGLHHFRDCSLAYPGSLTAKDQVFKLFRRLLLFQ